MREAWPLCTISWLKQESPPITYPTTPCLATQATVRLSDTLLTSPHSPMTKKHDKSVYGHTAPSLAFAFLSLIVITDTSDSILMVEDTTSFTPMVFLAWVSPIVIASFALMVAFEGLDR